MNLIRSFFIAFSMYSKIPMPRTDWTKEAMRYAMCFFPVIGCGHRRTLLYVWICLTRGHATVTVFFGASVARADSSDRLPAASIWMVFWIQQML